MSDEATAVAHPNVALSKYWGKRPQAGNFPAVPSLSVTLAGLETRTRVRWARATGGHRVILGGREQAPEQAARAASMLDTVRAAAGRTDFAEVETRNDFPTASGLASSASGFAALALAATRSAGLDWDAARVSDLARQASASAARSLFGGFVELEVGAASASPVAPIGHLPLAIVVAVTTEGEKSVGSTDGMQRTMAESPYAAAWLETAPRLHALLKEALLARDLERVGALAEASALAMHASALAAGVSYWNGATLDVLACVKRLRAEGTGAWATIDAGPHVKVITCSTDAPRVREALSRTPGVLRFIDAAPGEGARLEEEP